LTHQSINIDLLGRLIKSFDYRKIIDDVTEAIVNEEKKTRRNKLKIE
jgi:hypothetical protein